MSTYLPAARRLAMAGVIVVLLVAIGVAVVDVRTLRLAVAGSIVLLVLATGLRSPLRLLLLLVPWLTALGLVRRLTSSVSPAGAWGDPLLIVGSVAWMVLGAIAVRRGGFAGRTRLTNAVLLLGGVLAVSALNPAQGGLAVGLGGALVVVLPMAAFLVGRTFVDDRNLWRLVRLVGVLSIAAAVYGLLQTFRGFPSWDRTWIEQNGYAALNVGGTIRPFSSFSAASEYASFLGLGIVAWVAWARGAKRLPVAAWVLVLLATALWLESARGAVVLVVVALAAMAGVRAGIGMGRCLVVGTLAVGALPTAVGWVAPASSDSTSSGRLAQHQIAGLANPLGEDSTAIAHWGLVMKGVGDAFRQPLGVGVGATTIAGGKYGGLESSTEADVSNASVAVGVVGLGAYLAVGFLAFPLVFKVASRRRDPLALAALGVVCVTLFQWLNGGHYGVSYLAWLVLGWVDANAAAQPGVVSGGAQLVGDQAASWDGQTCNRTSSLGSI